ncbi:MAG: polyphosphate kinase 1 [Methanomassiliicoccaceae archaeon]|nr:polyphosphate kinase 1 [Methanomassiliicoccaceae archaeon]
MTDQTFAENEFEKCMQNREISWLKFNERVLEESVFEGNFLLERLKFISIFCSNLDEFYMIRVGSLTDYMLFAPDYLDNKTGMTAEEQLDAIFAHTSSLYTKMERHFNKVTDDLRDRGLYLLRMHDLSQEESKAVEKDFVKNIMPLLSPSIIDDRHPFPHIDNKWLHIGVTIDHKEFGLIAVPKTLDRIMSISGKHRFVLLEDVICHFAHLVFAPYALRERTVFAVTRNADISMEGNWSDADADYCSFIQKRLKKRRKLAPVRLELQSEVSKDFISSLTKKLDLKGKQTFITSVPLDLSYCSELEDLIDADVKDRLVRPPHVPADATGKKDGNLIKHAQKKDILLSYPFESASLFIEMMKQAADDQAVVSIKITLYRLDKRSRLAESLIRAAENGKEVIVLMELRARFDESNNIEWAQHLDEAGCRVIYGLPGYKVHSKISLITRKDHGKINYITQIGTGNYNERTAKIYTDLSLITADQSIGYDTVRFFNDLLIGNLEGEYDHLWVAPNGLKRNILECIDEESKKAENGRIIIKCNSLADKEIIVKLIEASQKGVKISLIVRGICCLIPGVPGFTDNISVISIIGRFLEHSRIFCFGNGDDTRIYISSADLMARNTECRIEIACPIYDADLKRRICGMLDIMLKDNTKAWDLLPSGRYVLRRPGAEDEVNSQEMFANTVSINKDDAGSERSTVNKRISGLRAFFSRRAK